MKVTINEGFKKVLALFVGIIVMFSVTSYLPVTQMEANAATFDEINSTNVLLTQQGNNTCTLVSAAMMLRRNALLRGDSNWASCTESSLKPIAWSNGLKWSFSYNGMSVSHSTLSGTDSQKTSTLISLLQSHPEGIALYAGGVPHCVLLTDYTNGTFYCADPLYSGRRELNSCYKVRISNANSYWYVSSPSAPSPSAHNPEGFIGSYSASGNQIYVDGGAYDPDDTSTAIRVDVYLRDSSGNMNGIGNLTANGERADANAKYGCGTNHGFGGTLTTTLNGTYTLLVALINIGDGDNQWLEAGSVTVSFVANNKPNLCIDSVTGGESAVTINGWAYDPDSKATSLAIHVYYNQNDGDYQWLGSTTANRDDDDGLKSVIGSSSSYKHRFSATFYLPAGTYQFHIAALDATDGGNNATWNNDFSATVTADKTNPTISKVSFSNVSKDGFRVEIDVKDNVRVKNVKVPVWNNATKNNSWQYDLVWYDAVQSNDTHWYCDVKTKNHDNYCGKYAVDIYAYDYCDNCDKWCGENSKRSWATPGMHTLTLNPNGGSINGSTNNWLSTSTNAQLIYGTDNYSIVSTWTPKRTGYTFNGWYTAATGGTKIYNSDGSCTNDGTYFKSNKYIKDSDMKVYAQWTLNASETTTIVTTKNVTTTITVATTVNVETTNASTTSNVTTSTEPIDTDKILLGDVNLDGIINIQDVVLISKYIAAPTKFAISTTANLNADVDGSGSVNNADIIAIAKLI